MTDPEKSKHSIPLFAMKKLSAYPYLHDRARCYHSTKSHQNRPDLCYCPLANTLDRLLAGPEGSPPPISIHEKGGLTELIELTAVLIYLHLDGIYVFDASLFGELIDMPFIGDIPMSELRQFPESCVYIQAPVVFEGCMALGFFAWLEYAPDSPQSTNVDFIIVFRMPDDSLIPRYYPLDGPRPQAGDMEAVKENAMSRQFRSINSLLPGEIEPLPESLKPLFHLLLYINSESADIFKPIAQKLKPGMASFGPTGVWKAGFRIGNVLRKFKNAVLSEWNEAAAADAARHPPYIRRAHWHTYWIGSVKNDTRHKVARWMPFIPVGLDWERELPVIARPVK